MKTKLQQASDNFAQEVINEINNNNFTRRDDDFDRMYRLSINDIDLSIYDNGYEIRILPTICFKISKSDKKELMEKLIITDEQLKQKRIAELKAELEELEKHVI